MTFVEKKVKSAAMLEKLKPLESNLLKSFLYLIIFLLILYFFPGLSAKVTCEGKACDILPEKYKSQFDNIDAAFQSQYLQPVLQSMMEAAVISNNSSGMIGVGYVNRFQAGVGLGAGLVKKEDITVRYGDMTIPKLPNAGIVATPTAMVAFNLGWILGWGPSVQPEKDSDEDENEEDENRTILHRFNFYFHGMKANYYTTEDTAAAYGKSPDLSGGLGVESFGAMIRYQIVEPNTAGFTFFGFSGVSIGLGYNMQNFTMSANHQPKTNSTVKFGELQGAWVGKTEFQFASNVRSIPIEIRTGVKLLYFFEIYTGVGLSRNYGTANLHLSKGGPIKLSLDPTFVYNSSLLTSDYYKYYSNNAFNPSNSLSNPEGTLSLDLRRKAKISNNTYYLIVGMEIDLFFLKVLTEATILEKSFGANVGLKVAF